MTESRPLVLVVEDEPQMRKFVRIALESHDYRVIEADDRQPRASSRRPPTRPTWCCWISACPTWTASR